MDPEVLTKSDHLQELPLALKSIPTVSLVFATEDLFGSERGIYAHPEETGVEWERPVSLEFFHPARKGSFQADCGARIQGGWNLRANQPGADGRKNNNRQDQGRRHRGPGSQRKVYGQDRRDCFNEMTVAKSWAISKSMSDPT